MERTLPDRLRSLREWLTKADCYPMDKQDFISAIDESINFIEDIVKKMQNKKSNFSGKFMRMIELGEIMKQFNDGNHLEIMAGCEAELQQLRNDLLHTNDPDRSKN